MLVTSNYKKNDVVTIKLSTGEELVAGLASSYINDDNLLVMRPHKVTLNPLTESLELEPWMLSAVTYNDDPVKIKQSHIVAITSPNKHAIALYNMKYSTNATMPDDIVASSLL